MKFYGKHRTKKFIREKLIKFGVKLFSLNLSDSPVGHLYHAEPYCDSDIAFLQNFFNLGANAVLGLAHSYRVPKESRLYFDDWFTSLQLL